MLNFTAHIQGGHYAVESIPAGGSINVDLLAASYNGVTVKPVRVFVSNYANDGQISVTVAGIIASIVPSYSNKNIEIQGLLSLTLSNSGTAAVNVMFADEKMLGIAADVYASLTVSSAQSQYDIVNNFELRSLTDIENEGLESGITYTVIAGTKLAGDAKFGDRCINNTDTSGNDTSGFIIEKTDFFDMTHDFTLGFWVKSPAAWAANTVLTRIGVENTLANSITIYGTPATSNNLTCNAFGVVTGLGGVAGTGWLFIALSKISNNLHIYYNQTRAGTIVLASPTNLLDKIGIGYAGLASASYKCPSASFDGLFYLDGIGLWNGSTMTPPTSAPV